jgi:uncharacterized protein
MRERVAVALALLAASAIAAMAAEPAIPTPRGFVTDTAGVLGPDVTARITALATELQEKTGAEIAVLTVPSTAPLDDFQYAFRVAETWKPGRAKEDTGVLVVLAVQDHRLRVLTGYGVEGVLPDGLVGQIEDEEMLPALRAGRFGEGIERGVRAFASRIAAEKGVRLTGVPSPQPRPESGPDWVTLLVLLLLLVGFVWLASQASRGRARRGRGLFLPGGFGGGFGGGGGGFGGFGGGSFGGGGAGRSW